MRKKNDPLYEIAKWLQNAEKTQVASIFENMDDDWLESALKNFQNKEWGDLINNNEIFHILVQVVCERFNLDVGDIDGYYGDKTANAVRKLQQKIGTGVDGAFGPKTLNKVLEQWETLKTWDGKIDVKKEWPATQEAAIKQKSTTKKDWNQKIVLKEKDIEDTQKSGRTSKKTVDISYRSNHVEKKKTLSFDTDDFKKISTKLWTYGTEITLQDNDWNYFYDTFNLDDDGFKWRNPNIAIVDGVLSLTEAWKKYQKELLAKNYIKRIYDEHMDIPHSDWNNIKDRKSDFLMILLMPKYQKTNYQI